MFYSLIAGLMILAAIVGMFILIGKIILYTRDPFEKTMRLISFSGGVLIFVGARGMGLNIPELMLGSMDSTDLIVGFLSSIAPALIGAFLTYYLFRVISKNRDKNQLIYFLILLATFIILVFSDLFIQNIFAKESTLGINVSFVVGIILTLLFKVEVFRGIYNFILEGEKKHKIEEKTESDWKTKL